MNPIEQLVSNFQDLVAQVPEFLQPLILVLAGAVPFVEGELASMIGVIGGVNPIAAAIAGATGNFLCVLLVVLLSSRARTAVVDRRAARASASAKRMRAGGVGVGSSTAGVPTTSIATVDVGELAADSAEPKPEKPLSKGRQRFNRWLLRFGVPGASILGPLAIPTQITSAILVAGGTPRAWVLLWQAVAITLWTTVGTTSVWLALRVATGA
ncbi:small multidrug efflux protein [Agreia sp. VKM Ac-1783]|uniref:small multidrug efflux protein n=1 Tax=Agreia sp. VKM Ac-1783 TaxID=1938889 RepID=UPI000A2AD59C|nr:small multidrug efflux protein [Agreia sp. VKM Ac-1783]SMQ74942.1 hypothetical protein SAMN06295943_3342 [Agreia sp. VKM Ac-1783]